MKCDAIRAMLERYMDGALAPDEMRTVETHLSGCAPCRKALAEWRSVDELGKSEFAPMPEEKYFRAMRSEIREKIQGLPKKSHKEKRKMWGWIWPESIPPRIIGISAAAAVLFLAIRIGIFLRDEARLGPVKQGKGMELVPQAALDEAPEPERRAPVAGAESVRGAEEKGIPGKLEDKETQARMEARSVAGISAGEKAGEKEEIPGAVKQAAEELHDAEALHDAVVQKAGRQDTEETRDEAAQEAGRQYAEKLRDTAVPEAGQPEKAPALKTAETKAVPAPYTEEEHRFQKVKARAGSAESLAGRINIWEQYASSKPDSAHLAMAGRALSELYMLEARDASDAEKIEKAVEYYRNFKFKMGPDFTDPGLDALERELEARLKNMEKEE